MATLHLMVGLPFSGKTTLARKLERECSALRLTPDEWHVRLFGQDAKEPEHDSRHSLIETMLWNIASRVLELGTNVILDFGFWAREEREDYRLRAKQLGASSEVHFLDVSEDELLRRLEERNSQPSRSSRAQKPKSSITFVPNSSALLAIFQSIASIRLCLVSCSGSLAS